MHCRTSDTSLASAHEVSVTRVPSSNAKTILRHRPGSLGDTAAPVKKLWFNYARYWTTQLNGSSPCEGTDTRTDTSLGRCVSQENSCHVGSSACKTEGSG